MGLHTLAIAAVMVLAAVKVSREVARTEVEVAFIGPGKGKGSTPPPPPPAAKKRTPTPHRKVARVEVPKPVLEVPKVVVPTLKAVPLPDPEEEKDDGDDGVESGVEGGMTGGVVGGAIGGVVGGTGGGGTMEPRPAERPKPKNVPAFAIARDLVRQVAPRMSEVFHNSHRGQTVTGMYKVCVDLDGAVYEVTPVKAIDGANEEIVDGIKSGWQYRPQQIPVCFLYNMVVRIEG